MEKEKKKGAGLPLLLSALAVLAVLFAGIVFAAQASSPQDCAAFPDITIDKQGDSASPGRISSVMVTVKGTQDASCGPQTYGVDFTNGYDGQQFVLAMKGMQERNLFALKPGESKEFEGLIGVPPGTAARNYTIQITAYPEADHWKQSSKTFALAVRPEAGNDAYWKTELQIGWNNIPYVNGMGAYGCPDIITGYRYSASKGDYITLNRYGALFEVAPFEPNMDDEKFGGLFVFSKSRCTMESRAPAESFDGAAVPLRGGQLLSIPPAWHGQSVAALLSACKKQASFGSDTLEVKMWSADKQQWLVPTGGEMLKNGQVVRLLANYACSLDMEQKLGN